MWQKYKIRTEIIRQCKKTKNQGHYSEIYFKKYKQIQTCLRLLLSQSSIFFQHYKLPQLFSSSLHSVSRNRPDDWFTSIQKVNNNLFCTQEAFLFSFTLETSIYNMLQEYHFHCTILLFWGLLQQHSFLPYLSKINRTFIQAILNQLEHT